MFSPHQWVCSGGLWTLKQHSPTRLQTSDMGHQKPKHSEAQLWPTKNFPFLFFHSLLQWLEAWVRWQICCLLRTTYGQLKGSKFDSQVLGVWDPQMTKKNKKYSTLLPPSLSHPLSLFVLFHSHQGRQNGPNPSGQPVYPQKIGGLGLKNNNPFKLTRFQSGPFNSRVKQASPRG